MNRTLILSASIATLAGCAGTEDDTAMGDPCQSGAICTYLGTGVAGLPLKGGCRLEQPTYLVVDMTVGPDGDLYYLDWNNHTVVHLAPGDGTGFGESCDSLEVVTGTTLLGDGPEGPAETAAWNHPTNISFRPDGALVFAAWHNSRVVAVDLVASTVDWFVGTGKRDFAGDGGPAADAVVDLPVGVEYDTEGNLYIADQANQRIRKVNASDAIINTIAGTGEYGYNGDDIPATEAMLFNELSQAAAPAGKLSLDGNHLYIADTSNNRIRMITMDDGIIHTVAGTGTPGYSGDGGPATAAQINGPRDVDVGPDGTVYFADTGSNCVRAIDPSGNIRTFAGTCGEAGYTGDGGDPTAATLYQPFGVEVDWNTGAVYIADTYNNVIRVVNP